MPEQPPKPLTTAEKVIGALIIAVALGMWGGFMLLTPEFKGPPEEFSKLPQRLP